MTDPVPLRPLSRGQPRPAAARVLLAVVPLDEADAAGRWDAADPSRGVEAVAYRDVAALVMPHGGELPDDPAELVARHEEVHRALLRGSVLPAPLGVTFADTADVERFLAGAYASLRAALARVEGRWEFRLHVELVEPVLSESMALDLVTHIYAELRRVSTSAIPFPRGGGRRLLSAAFLVARSRSVAFQKRVEELGRLNAALALDLTGPWPAYDFVQMHGV